MLFSFYTYFLVVKAPLSYILLFRHFHFIFVILYGFIPFLYSIFRSFLFTLYFSYTKLDQLSLTGQAISPRAPLPSPRRNSISTATPTTTTPKDSTPHAHPTPNTHDDKLRNLHGRVLARGHSSSSLSKYADSPVSRIPSFQDSPFFINKAPSQPKFSSPALLIRAESDKIQVDSPGMRSPPSNVSLELRETPTNLSLEEGGNTIESRNEEDFASFLHKDSIQERYLTPTPGRRSRYDDLQLSLDKDPPNSSQILRPVDEEDEIQENIDVEESYEKLDEELGITPRRQHEQSPSLKSPPQEKTPTPPTPSKSGRSSFNVLEFKKNLQTFNKQHSLPQKKESNATLSDYAPRQASPNRINAIKNKHAACVIQRWWRQMKESRIKVI